MSQLPEASATPPAAEQSLAAPPPAPTSQPPAQMVTPSTPQPYPVPRAPAHQVAPAAIRYWTVKALLPVLVAAAIEVLILWPNQAPPVVWIPIAGATVLLAAIYVIAMPRIRYRVHRWEQTSAAFYTRSGWVVVEQRLAPLSRVQTVDVERGLIENWFGLATLTVTTASAAGPLKVPALDRATADRVADELGRIAGASRDDAT